MTRLRTGAIALASLALTGALSACTGSSVEGTYFGTAGDTVLVLASDGRCGYTDDYDKDEGVKVEIEEKCSWSLSGKNLTLIGVSRSGSLTGFIGDDGSISIPDQGRWNGEIYTKQK